MKKPCLYFCIIAVLSIQSVPAIAAPSKEIQYLLDFIGSTKCTFIRNGEAHNANEALTHITKKYMYYKDKIKSSEDFIRYSATGSLISKKSYYVDCPNQEDRQRSADWLLKELSRYRLALAPKS